MLKSAIALRRSGFSVIWLKKKTKEPVGEGWTKLPTRSVDELKSSYVQGYNCGVRLGEHSEIDGAYLHVIDIDIRKPEYAAEARKMVERLLGKRITDFQAVISGSGGASRHLYFTTDKPFRSKKLWWTTEKFTGDDGKEHWAAEIELFGTGKQVVLPPSIHPDTGLEYRWQDGEFYWEDILHIDSEVIEDLIGAKDEHYVDDEGPLGLSLDEINDYLDELDVPTYCEDREGWIKVGMALHHEFDGDVEGLKIWNAFSKQSKKFDLRVSKQQWRSFGDSDRPVTFATVIQAANECAHQRTWESIADEFEDDDEDTQDDRPAPKKDEKQTGVPADLLTIPGILGTAVKHYNDTSTRYQPQFAVQAALALGSVVLGRHWMSETDNFTSLYLVNLGATGRGKEFGRTFLERILEEANLGHLVGPMKYASEAAVMGELSWKPRHVTVYDEFGRLLSSTNGSGNTNLRDAQTLLMSLFGQLGGVARATAYSTNGKTAQQVEAARNQRVVRPAVTILGLSTPETFFDALSQDDVANGFLNRLLVVNSRQPRRVEKPKSWKKIPRELLSWLVTNGEYGDDFMAGESPVEVEEPEMVFYTDAALERLDEIEQEVIDLQDEFESKRLDGMFSRSREIAMRIALIVTISRNKKKIDEASLNWAWDYVRYHTMEMVENVKRMMGASPIIRIAEHLADIITSAGRKGLRQSDIIRMSVEFARLDKRGQDEVIHRLTNQHEIVLVKAKKEGRGRPSMRYVHADYID